MNKKVKLIWNIATWVLVLIVALLAVLMVGVRVVGLTPYAVLSGSMEPTYHVGSLIYVKHAEPQEIKVGDPITFVLNQDLAVATHRVISIDEANQEFHTKGDANQTADSGGVYFPNLVGKPVFTVPYLGFFSEWITHPPGMYIGITGGVILIILVFLPDVLEKADAADQKKKAEKKASGNQQQGS